MNTVNIKKPLKGQPCNGCGLCCLMVPCPVADHFLNVSTGSCPALEFEDGRYWCGILRNAHKHIPGMSEKPWADEYFREMLMETGGWQGVCDSEDE